MKTLNLTFEDQEHEHMQQQKGDKSWREYILQLSGYQK